MSGSDLSSLPPVPRVPHDQSAADACFLADIRPGPDNYHIVGGLHQMDAVTRNKAEAELLALLREMSITIGVPFHVETRAFGEGGVVEYWNLVFQHKEHIAFILSVLGTLLGAPFYRGKLRQSDQQTQINELNIRKLKLELEEKEAAARDRSTKQQQAERTAPLPLEPALSPEEIAKALLGRKKIARRRSNYYQRLIEESSVEAVGFAQSHLADAQEHVVPRGQFSDFVIADSELPPLIYKGIQIELVSPVLRNGSFKWRGIFDKRVIGFDLEDNVFRERVAAKRVQFQNGTVLVCDLEVRQREDESGDAEVVGYAVMAVRDVVSPPPPEIAASDAQLQLQLPTDSSTHLDSRRGNRI